MKKYVIANWKMNPATCKEALKFFNAIQKGVKGLKSKKDVTIVVCPPFPFLSIGNGQLSNVALGAQDCFWEHEGPYTGEVSPVMLSKIGCEYVVLGHSERRIHLGETDGMIAKKVKAALGVGLKVILCVGENREQRQAGEIREVIERQITVAVGQLSNVSCQMLIVAYEPVWAISGFNGKAASVQDVAQVTGWIRGALKKKFGKEGEFIFMLYGGSVKSESVQEYLWGGGIHGFLVGSASLDPHEFLEIIKQCQC